MILRPREEGVVASEVSIPTVKRLEARGGPLGVRDETREKIRRALD